MPIIAPNAAGALPLAQAAKRCPMYTWACVSPRLPIIVVIWRFIASWAADEPSIRSITYSPMWSKSAAARALHVVLPACSLCSSCDPCCGSVAPIAGAVSRPMRARIAAAARASAERRRARCGSVVGIVASLRRRDRRGLGLRGLGRGAAVAAADRRTDHERRDREDDREQCEQRAG